MCINLVIETSLHNDARSEKNIKKNSTVCSNNLVAVWKNNTHKLKGGKKTILQNIPRRPGAQLRTVSESPGYTAGIWRWL